MIQIHCIVSETRGILALDVFESLAERVKCILERYPSILPAEFTCAASLAHHRLLGSVQGMSLMDVDLTSIPAENLVSLASCVTENYIERVHIQNVSGCGLITILDSVKIEERMLLISKQSLGSEETQALVRAMESRVGIMGLDGEATLDIRVLIEYNGQGKCRWVDCFNKAADRYREQLKVWATNRNWKVTPLDDRNFFIEKI